MHEPLTLYIAPGACSRVTMLALEEAGLPYTIRKVGLMQGEQRTPGYLSLNPKGKVPVLVTAEGTLTENVAILSWLDAQQPQAGLLPPADRPFERAQALSWLSWSTTQLHSMLYRVRMTARIHPDAATHEAVRAAALGEMAQQLVAAEQVLADGRPWLGGERWHIGDGHVTWVTDRARQSGLSLDALPGVAALLERQMQRPAWSRVLARENADA